eukprot:2412393-Pyramimonas_sp.AAC.1
MVSELTLQNELALGELMCARTDEHGAFCSTVFESDQIDRETCAVARRLGCCMYTMEWFENSCGFNSTTNVNLTAVRNNCDLPATVCKNVNLHVDMGCKLTAAESDARCTFAACGSAAALVNMNDSPNY